MVKKSKSNKKVVIIMLIVLLLALAVGYAAFSDILTISGTANAKGTFDLEFQNAEVVKMVGVNEEETTAVISEDKNTLTVKVADLSYPGAGVEYSVDIVNVGTIPARVNEIKVSNLAGSEHIEIKGLEVIDTEHPTINPKEKCNIHFTVEWPKEKDTEIAENEEATFELQIEYTQATTESFDGNTSHEDVVGNTTGGGEVVPPIEEAKVNLAETITGADYGKSINYKAIVQGQEVSNWRIFLNDGSNVYIILDDFLPNTLVPTATGLSKGDTTKPYSVWHSTRDGLISALTTKSHWSEFANGVSGATATGGATNAQFVASWNRNPVVNARQLKPETVYDSGNNGGLISDPTKLYVPHTEQVASSCNGYWLASPYADNSYGIWRVGYYGFTYYYAYGSNDLGVRPVVCLPSDILGTIGETVEI